jgi:putative FmdB family regulatory protein
MPLYEFRCRRCEHPFEERVPYGELPPCPECGSAETERILSGFSGPFTVGMRGYAARQSNAKRAAREEQRAERKAERKEQRRRQGPS